MRKLIILRGAQGSGKSTFIQEKNLERFTLSSDTIRLMFNAPELTIDYTETIPQFNNKKVWQLLFFVLEERMKKGEFTLVDAIHASKEDLTTYKKLAEKYRYRLYILDFTNVPKEEAIKRNKNRVNYKIVPEYSIERAYKKFATEEISKAFIQIKPENFETILTKTPKDYNDYQNIHIIGDIHGCYSALKRYFEKNPFQEKDFYIFTGDYFDRGIENVRTFHYLTEFMKQKNILFLTGNHEDKIYKYACDDDFIMDYDIQNTIKEFESKGITKANMRGFIKALSQLAYITFQGKTYIITHGGIPYFPKQPLDYYSTNSFMYGIDKYDVDIDEIYNEYMNNQDEKIIQIHGHRNYFKNEMNKYPYSYNVEGDIEHGGYLRILTLKNNGSVSFTSVKNEVYNPNLLEETKIYTISEYIIIPDERDIISKKLKEIADEKKADIIFTTGGTGFSKRDVTPEATKDIIEKETPGISEAIRAYSMTITPRAMLSRAVSGIRKDTLIINLPGSPKAVRESLEYILPSLSHGLNILLGREAECGQK